MGRTDRSDLAALRFINQLTHTNGQWAGESFSLRPWQQDILTRLFGTLLADGRRQYRVCYVEIPRKNGKTELAAAIALYMLLADGEFGAQVYSAACDLEQASLAFNVASQMVRNDSELASLLEIIPSRKRIVHHATGSFYRAIPADAPSAHGYNASAIICDELHAWRDRELYTVLRTSMGARRQPLIFIITTAGWDRTSICWELHSYAERVEQGLVDDPTFLPILYRAPIGADWQDEKVWAAANPALGDFRSLDDMRMMAKQAIEMPAQQNEFRRLYLCQWTEQHTRWLDMNAWQRGAVEVEEAELVGAPCYAGLDLGQTDDFSAFVRLWDLEDGRVVVKCHFWIPEATLRKNRSRPYDVWRAQGILTVTDGESVDQAVIERDVASMCLESGVRELAYDKRFADYLRQRLEAQGILCIDTPQGFFLNESLRDMATLVVSGKLLHGGDPILTWMAANAVVRVGAMKQDIRLDKEKAGEKIDGISALVMANSRRVAHAIPGVPEAIVI